MAEAVSSATVSQAEAEESFGSRMKEFTTLIRKNEYRGQAIYFLNAFWREVGDKIALDVDNEPAKKEVKIVERTGVRYEKQEMTWPQQIYEWVQLMTTLSNDSKGSNLNALDESGGARFLEIEKRAKTVLARRKMLQKVDIDSDNHMSLFEWLLACEQLFDCTKTAFSSTMSIQQRFHELMTRPQGTNEALEKAQAALAAVMEAIADIEKKIKKNQEIIASKPGIVKRNKAQNEIDQINSRFPDTEMNRKLMTAQAAVRKATKGGADGQPGVMPGANWYLNFELEIAQKYKPSSKK